MTGTPEIEGRAIVVDRLGAEGKCRPREVRECQAVRLRYVDKCMIGAQ